MKIREILCKTAISKCGFPGGGWAINPYVGCEHGCLYGITTYVMMGPYWPVFTKPEELLKSLRE